MQPICLPFDHDHDHDENENYENGHIMVGHPVEQFFEITSHFFFISLDFVQPICLPFDHDENENYEETTRDQNLEFDVFVAGWGATNERGRDPADALQKLNVPIFPGKNNKI